MHLDGDPAFALERDERLPHRDAADTERLGDVVLRDPLARSQPAVHVDAAHSDADTVVFFRRSDVVSTGAIFDASGYPRFDVARGGSIAGVIEGLNRVLDIAVPGENQEGGTVIVPGRGRLSDETDVANYRDMVTIIRDRVRAMVAKGQSLQQVQQARPTSDYDGLFEESTDWTHEMFLDAIYRDLTKSGERDSRSGPKR